MKDPWTMTDAEFAALPIVKRLVELGERIEDIPRGVGVIATEISPETLKAARYRYENVYRNFADA